MWDLIVSVPDHCLSFYFFCMINFYDHYSICRPILVAGGKLFR